MVLLHMFCLELSAFAVDIVAFSDDRRGLLCLECLNLL